MKGSMQRLCFVVQRYGKDVLGGSEQLTRCYAQLLKRDYEIHVATTCAADHATWRNHFPEGITNEEDIIVHRFPNDFERTEHFHKLHYELILRHLFVQDSPVTSVGEWHRLWTEPMRKQLLIRAVENLSQADQEEFERHQGPYSSAFLHFLEREHKNYDAVVFFTYLYPTTYFGSFKVPSHKRILVPTLHDEPCAYLPIFREMAESFARLIFLSPGERSYAKKIWKLSAPGTIIGMPVEAVSPKTALTKPCPSPPYVVYCGRIDEQKGSHTLFEYFLRYKENNPSDLKLVLTGHADEPVPVHSDIVYLGYVEEAYKSAILKQAAIFIHPSPFESFSIVLLEAFLNGTPALVNANSLILTEHCRTANAGLWYETYEEFAECLSLLISDPKVRNTLGENGRQYVQQNYSTEVILPNLKKVLDEYM
jgi:glycosyltransferase involved in cell wall biosynthesis